jgi:hypothetical protein
MRLSWVFATALLVPSVWAVACGGSHSALNGGDGDDGGGGSGSSSTGSGSGFNTGSGSTTGVFMTSDGGTITVPLQGACKGGHYDGTFGGLYTSVLTGIGFPIPVAGNVSLDLDQETTMGTCHPAGELPVPCSDVFTLKNGTISGTADGLFPYFCVMTGTLDCMSKVLDEGWIQCTYCAGLLGGTDAGPGYCIGGTNDSGAGLGGRFAGPLTAEYDVSMLAFVNGNWNGAEALAGNNGMMPGPDGGSIWNYLSDSGLYLGPGDFGGSGTWNATLDDQ